MPSCGAHNRTCWFSLWIGCPSLQASTAPPSPFDASSTQGLLQLAANGLLPHHLNGPATPNPSPLAPTPFSSPEAPHQHQQLLAALQALPNMPPQSFGAGVDSGGLACLWQRRCSLMPVHMYKWAALQQIVCVPHT